MDMNVNVNYAREQKYVVNTDVLNMRVGPNTDFAKCGKLYRNAIVDVKGYVGEWAWLGDSFVHTDYLIRYTDDVDYVTTTARVNMRKGPGTNYYSMGLLNKGTKVKFLDEKNNWFKVQWNKKVFWISGRYVR